jgi:hypothetical protein
MDKYIESWLSELANRPQRTISESFAVTGTINRHTGPKIDNMSVRVNFAPADDFTVVNKVPMTEELIDLRFPEMVVFGILDLMMTAEWTPVVKIKITLEAADYHPIDCSPWGFLEAGRDAARKAIQVIGLRGTALKWPP